MELIELKMKNFKSHLDATINFVNGNNVIVGENGAGKSSILEGIMYALYGNVQGRKLEDLVRKGTSKMEIQLTFKHGGKTYKVTRTGQLMKSSTKTTAKLHVQGKKDPIATKQSVVSQEIERILGHDAKTFQNVVYIRQGEITQIFSHTPQTRKELFDRLLGLEKYETAYKRLADPIKKLKHDIDMLNVSIEALEENVSKIPQVEKEVKQFRKKISSLNNEIEKLQQKLVDKQKILKELERLKTEVELTEKQLTERKKTLEKKELQTKQEHDNLQRELNQQFQFDVKTIRELITTLETKRRKKEQMYEQFNNEIKMLDTLKTKIDELLRLKKKQENHIQEMETENEQLKTEIRKLLENEYKNEPYEKVQERIHEDIQVENEKLKKIQKQRDTLVKKLERLKQLKDREDEYLKDIDDTRNSLANDEKHLRRVLGADWKELNLQELIEKLKKQKESLETRQEKLEEEKRRLIGDQIATQRKIRELEEEKETFENITKEAHCPTCKQIITEKHRTMMINEYEKQLKKLKIEHVKLEETISALTKQEQQVKSSLENIKNELKSKENSKIYLQNYKEKERKIQNLMEKLTKIQAEIKDLKVAPKDLEKLQEQIKTIEQKLLILQNASKLMVRLSEKTLNIKQRRKELEILNKNIQDHEKKYDKQKHEQLLQQLQIIKEENARIIDMIGKLTNLEANTRHIEELQTQISRYQARLKELAKQFSLDEYVKQKQKHDQLNRQIDVMKGKILGLEETLPNKEKELETLKAKKQQLKETKISLERKKEILQITQTLRNFYREVAPDLRARYIHQVSSIATDIFRKINKNPAYQAINIDEDYNIWVIRFGKREKIELLSGGEQVAAGLAIRFAISQVIGAIGLLILDEPTIHLDSQRQRDLVDIFDKNRFSNQMITVTHNEEFESLADQVILVERDDQSKSRVIIK